MTIVTCVVAILGCILDITDRKDIPLNQNILTLQTFDKETNLKNIQTTNILKSFIVESTSYFEENNQGDLMYSKDYCFKSTDKTNTFFKRYLKTYDDVPVIKIDKNTYLFKLDTSYDTLHCIKEKIYFCFCKFQFKNDYQNIIEFYK